ncbi:L-rhamnose-binding lectin CSL3-like [Oculina patagonica]
MLRLLGFCLLTVLFVSAEEHRRVCEHKVMTITCPDSMEINILSASYGRTQQGLCGRNGNTKCHAGTSMRIARHECQGQPRCTLHASNTVFGDPCVGTLKYLEIKYKCVHKTELCGEGLLLRVCEGTRQAIRCEAPTKINIVSANYGRLDRGNCPGPIKTDNCGAAGSLSKVRRDCQGKRECVLHATNGQYGDPCVGTRKYIEVRYKCEYQYK